MHLQFRIESTRNMNQKSLLFFTLTFVTSVFFISCKHENPFLVADNTPVVGGPQDCNADSVYFKNTIQPMLNSSCAMSGCHDAASHKKGIVLTSYSEIVNTGGLIPFNAPISRLYKCLNGSGEDLMPRAPASPFTPAQKEAVYKWIMQGAQNNACSNCDTNVFSYSAAIAPMMATYCNGCHNPSLTGGGYDFTTYDGVQQAVLYERLFGSVAHSDGYSEMPQGSDKLSDCKITQLQKWIDAGAPNN